MNEDYSKSRPENRENNKMTTKIQKPDQPEFCLSARLMVDGDLSLAVTSSFQFINPVSFIFGQWLRPGLFSIAGFIFTR